MSSSTPQTTGEKPLPSAEEYVSMKNAWAAADKAAWKARRIVDTSHAGLIWGLFACLACLYVSYGPRNEFGSASFNQIWVILMTRVITILNGAMIAVLFISRWISLPSSTDESGRLHLSTLFSLRQTILLACAVFTGGITVDCFPYLGIGLLGLRPFLEDTNPFQILGGLSLVVFIGSTFTLVRSLRSSESGVQPRMLIVPIILAPFMRIPIFLLAQTAFNSQRRTVLTEVPPALVFALAALALSGYLITRYRRFRLWEYLLLAGCVLVAAILFYLRLHGAPLFYISAIPVLGCILAIYCLFSRVRDWAREFDANEEGRNE